MRIQGTGNNTLQKTELNTEKEERLSLETNPQMRIATDFVPQAGLTNAPSVTITTGDIPDFHIMEGGEEEAPPPLTLEELTEAERQLEAELDALNNDLESIEAAWESLLNAAGGGMSPELQNRLDELGRLKDEVIDQIQATIEDRDELLGYVQEALLDNADIIAEEEAAAAETEAWQPHQPREGAHQIAFGDVVPGGEEDIVITLPSDDNRIRATEDGNDLILTDENGRRMVIPDYAEGNRRVFLTDSGGNDVLIVDPEVDIYHFLGVSDSSTDTYGGSDGIEEAVISNERITGGGVTYNNIEVDSDGVVRTEVTATGDADVYIPENIGNKRVTEVKIEQDGNEWTIEYYGAGGELLGVTELHTSSQPTFHGNDNASEVDASDTDGITYRGSEESEGDHIIGSSHADDIRGGDGDDWIEGGGGDDDIRGGKGDDLLDAGGGNDTVRGGRGRDILVDSGPADNTGEDNLYGEEGEDIYHDPDDAGDDFYAYEDGENLIMNKDTDGEGIHEVMTDETASRQQVMTYITERQDEWEDNHSNSDMEPLEDDEGPTYEEYWEERLGEAEEA